MATKNELLLQTFETMESGDMLQIGGLPDQDRAANVSVGLGQIVPIKYLIGSPGDEPRPNGLVREGAQDTFLFRVERTGARFGFDCGGRGPEISHGSNAGVILGQTVDLVVLDPLSNSPYYFIAKQ